MGHTMPQNRMLSRQLLNRVDDDDKDLDRLQYETAILDWMDYNGLRFLMFSK